MQVQNHLAAFEELGCRVVAISFVTPQRLQSYLERRSLSMTCLSDPSRKAYRAFGLERVGWWRLLRPQAWGVYLRLILRGQLPRRPQEDVHQLGGDFLFAASGRLVYAYRSEGPTDRPTVDQLLEVAADPALRE